MDQRRQNPQDGVPVTIGEAVAAAVAENGARELTERELEAVSGGEFIRIPAKKTLKFRAG